MNNLKGEFASYSGLIVNLAAILNECLKRIFYWLFEDYSDAGLSRFGPIQKTQSC